MLTRNIEKRQIVQSSFFSTEFQKSQQNNISVLRQLIGCLEKKFTFVFRRCQSSLSDCWRQIKKAPTGVQRRSRPTAKAHSSETSVRCNKRNWFSCSAS
jgi:hypothetical protein